MKKSFRKNKTGLNAAQEMDIILGDDFVDKDKNEISPKDIIKEKIIRDSKAEEKEDDSKGKRISQKEEMEKIDLRRVDDKKVPFTSSIRGSINEKFRDVLKDYRQKVDFEYNKAQLLEDAIISQIDKLEKKIAKR